MTAWFLFGILAFLVFGMPFIDDLYKMKVRRRAAAASQIPDESQSLVPNANQENLIDSEVTLRQGAGEGLTVSKPASAAGPTLFYSRLPSIFVTMI